MAIALPVISLVGLADEDAGALQRVAAAIGAACREVGFFYVVDHGVEPQAIKAAFAASRRFFALPRAEKAALAIEKIGGNRGYSGLLNEALDPKRGPDLEEAFNIGLELSPYDPEFIAGVPFRALNAWPELAGFRATLLAYFEACAALGARLHRAFARDLGLPLDFFADKFDHPMATLQAFALSRWQG